MAAGGPVIHGPANVASDANVGRRALRPAEVATVRHRLSIAGGHHARHAMVVALAEVFGVSDRTIYRAALPDYGTRPVGGWRARS